jgi:hypothetical protein
VKCVEKGLNIGSTIHFSSSLGALCQAVAQKSIILKCNTLLLFPKIKSALKERIFRDKEDILRKCDNGTESYSTTGVPKIFPMVAASLG